jgi:RNA polymerase sigma-70 factor (ECF subfamily)
MVRLTLTRWTGCRDVDDLTQEVFACLFERIQSLQQPAALRSFIIGITLRMVCAELRRRRRARLRVTVTGQVPEPDDYYRRTAHDTREAREALSRMEDVLARLSPSARHAFLLRCVLGMELTEVATELRVSLSTAKRRVAKAKSCVAAMVCREPALAAYVATSEDPSLRCAPSNLGQDDRDLRGQHIPAGRTLKQVAQAEVA